VDDRSLTELLRCRDEAIALCVQATRLAEKVRLIIDEQARQGQEPGRRKRHLRVVKGVGIAAALGSAWRLLRVPAAAALAAAAAAALVIAPAVLRSPSPHQPPVTHVHHGVVPATLSPSHRAHLNLPVTATPSPEPVRTSPLPVPVPATSLPAPLPTTSLPVPVPSPSPTGSKTCNGIVVLGKCIPL
jgi:hypothetical protein